MELSEQGKQEVEERVARMIAELRARPTQEKEDLLGLEVATMPEEEREYVTVVLLRLVGEGARR